MTHPRTSALDLWGRLISGEMLDEAEMRQLIELRKTDPLLHAEIQADATLNALLRSISEVQHTEDFFVQAVLDRCRPLDRTRTTESADRSHADVSLEQSGGGGATVESEDLDEVLDLRSVQSRPVASRSDQLRRHDAPYRMRRQYSAWTAILLTTVLFTCLGMIVWKEIRSPIDISRNSAPREVIPVERQGGSSRPDGAPAHRDPATSLAGSNSPSDPSMPNDPGRQDIVDSGLEGQDRAEIPEVNQRGPIDGDANHLKPNPPVQSVSPIQFVTLTKLNDPVWEQELTVGDRIGDGIVRLFAGSVELTFDDGAVVTVDGPIEFRPLSTGELELRRGRIFASVPEKAIGFTVSTPTSKVIDLGTEFEVAVNDAGESDVQVHKGEVEVAPIAPDGDKFQKWRLIPSEFDRASFFARPRAQGPAPVSASLQGSRGRFQGFVSFNGQTAEFSSPEAFDNVRQRATTEFARSRQNALRQWEEFVNSMQRGMRGSMKVNGRELRFDSLQDVIRLQSQMLEGGIDAEGHTGNSSFSGSINVNGRVMTFKTREEYEAARRAAFGSAADFGAGDVLGGRPIKK